MRDCWDNGDSFWGLIDDDPFWSWIEEDHDDYFWGSIDWSPSPFPSPSSPLPLWARLAGVDPVFAKLVDDKEITHNVVLDTELTDLLRGAYYNEYLAERAKGYLGFRPLPLATTIINSRGQEGMCKLFPHQVKAITYMGEREAREPRSVYGLCGGVIKMEMGLGKTLTAITHSLLSP